MASLCPRRVAPYVPAVRARGGGRACSSLRWGVWPSGTGQLWVELPSAGLEVPKGRRRLKAERSGALGETEGSWRRSMRILAARNKPPRRVIGSNLRLREVRQHLSLRLRMGLRLPAQPASLQRAAARSPRPAPGVGRERGLAQAGRGRWGCRAGRGRAAAPAARTPWGLPRRAGDSGPYGRGVWGLRAGSHGGRWSGLLWRGRCRTGSPGVGCSRGKGALPCNEVHHGGR